MAHLVYEFLEVRTFLVVVSQWVLVLQSQNCLQAIESLRSNKHIFITKPDKGFGVVILNRSEYDQKMVAILSDVTKFECLGPVNQFDSTVQNKTKLQRRLLQLVKSDDLPKTVYEVIRPTGSQ